MIILTFHTRKEALEKTPDLKLACRRFCPIFLLEKSIYRGHYEYKREAWKVTVHFLENLLQRTVPCSNLLHETFEKPQTK